mgnify:CR=1 FL=1
MTDTATLQRLLDQLATTVVGKGEQLRVVLAAVLAGGHVWLEDVPGVGKALAASATIGGTAPNCILHTAKSAASTSRSLSALPLACVRFPVAPAEAISSSAE